MGLWILETSGSVERAILVRSDTETPLPIPVFMSAEDAESFVEYCKREPFFNLLNASDSEVRTMHDRWLMLPTCANSGTGSVVFGIKMPDWKCGKRVIDDHRYCLDCREVLDS